MARSKALFLLFWLLVPLFSFAQDQSGTEAETEQTNIRHFDESSYESATDGLKYEEKPPEPPKPREADRSNSTYSSSEPRQQWNLQSWARILLMVLAAVVLALLVIYFLRGNLRLPGRGRKMTIEELLAAEEDLPQSDLERLLKQALNAGQWRIAVRIYYLMLIQTLSLQGLIRWEKEKTNAQYLREVRAHPLHPNMRKLTLLFERIWYGEQPVAEREFNVIEPQFKEVIQKLQKHG